MDVSLKRKCSECNNVLNICEKCWSDEGRFQCCACVDYDDFRKAKENKVTKPSVEPRCWFYSEHNFLLPMVPENPAVGFTMDELNGILFSKFERIDHPIRKFYSLLVVVEDEESEKEHSFNQQAYMKLGISVKGNVVECPTAWLPGYGAFKE